MKRRDRWFAWSAAGQIAAGVAGLATNVAYTRGLPIHDVATIAVANAVATIMVVGLDRGIGAWLTRNLPTQSLSPRFALSFALRSGVPVLASIAIAVAILGAFLQAPGTSTVLVCSVALALTLWLFQLAIVFAQSFLTVRARSAAIAGNGVLTLALTAGVLWFNATVALAIVASVLAYLSVAVVVFWQVARSWRRTASTERTQAAEKSRRIDRPQARREARPLLGANVATFGVSAGDVLLAAAALSPTAVAQYQIAKKVAQAGTLPFSAAAPVLLGRLSVQAPVDGQRAMLRFATGFAIAAFVAGLCASPLLPMMLGLAFGDAYRDAATVTLILGCALCLQVLRDLLGAFRTATGDYRSSLLANWTVAGVLAALAAVFFFLLSLESFAACVLVAMLSGVAVHLHRLAGAEHWTRDESRKVWLLVAALAFAAGLGSFEIAILL